MIVKELRQIGLVSFLRPPVFDSRLVGWREKGQEPCSRPTGAAVASDGRGFRRAVIKIKEQVKQSQVHCVCICASRSGGTSRLGLVCGFDVC